MVRLIGGLQMSDFLDDIMNKLGTLSREDLEKLLYRTGSIIKDYEAQDSMPLACPHCGSTRIRKHGATKCGTPRMYCNECKRAFTYGNEQVFNKGRLNNDMASALVVGLVENKSIRELADAMGVSESTAHAYKLIMMDILAQELADELRSIDDKGNYVLQLAGNIQMDEYYVPLSFKGKRDPAFFIKKLHRFPYHHSTYKERMQYLEKHGLADYVTSIPGLFEALLENTVTKQRGTSHDQVCIVVGVDEYGKLIADAVSVGHLEVKDAMRMLSGRFNSNCLLITDGLQSYGTVAEFENISHIAVDATKHVKDGYSLGTINSIHSQMSKDWSESEERIPSTKYLPQYLALFIWRWQHKDMYYTDRLKLMQETLVNGYEKYAKSVDDIKKRPFKLNPKGKFSRTDV